MKIRMFWAICGCAILGAAIGAPRAWAQEEFHARVSFDAGGTLIKGNDDADWSHATVNTLVMGGDSLWVDKEGTTELEMAGGSFLRMADSSKAEISSLPPSAAVRAYTGSFYVHRLRRSSGQFTLMTPAAVVDIANDTEVRIDVNGQGGATVSVHWGRATVRAEGAAGETASESQRIYVDPGMLPSDPEPFNVSSEDDFDQWNRERTANLVEGFKRVPADVPMQQTTVGAGDLAPYGEWVRVDNRYCWHPTVVADYVPYRTGHWSYVPGVGYVWVEEYPFSYVTTHYGRWIHSPSYGWVWGYDPVWSPAWCATVHYGDNLVWSPIGFDNLPVVTTSSATFKVGGVLFSFGASSFVPVNASYYGGPVIRPMAPIVIQNVAPAQINVWNITVNNYNSPVHVPYVVKDMHALEYRPHVITRGPSTFGALTVKAGDRARTLESKSTVAAFVAPPKLSATAARTQFKPAQDRTALRSVRIEPEQRVVHTAQGAKVEAKPLVKQEADGKLRTKPATVDTLEKGKESPGKTELHGPGKDAGIRERGATTTGAPGKTDPKTGKPEPLVTDTAKDKVSGQDQNKTQGKTGKTEPLVTDTAKDKATGQDKVKTRRTVGPGQSPLVESGPGKTDAVTGNAKDKASGQDKVKTNAHETVVGPGSKGDSEATKTDALTGKPQTKTRGQADRTVNRNPAMVEKTPTVVDKTPKLESTGSGDSGKDAAKTRRVTTQQHPSDDSVSKTGPTPTRGKPGVGADDSVSKGTSKFGTSDKQPVLDTTKGKTPPSTIPPDTARGKGTIRDKATDKAADKNKKKTNGKPGQDSSDDSSDDKVVR